MLEVVSLPDLTFHDVEVGSRESSWDLTYLLYQGGAGANTRRVGRLIASGELNAPVTDRLLLVKKIHEVINAKMVAGGSMYTGMNLIRATRDTFIWAELNDAPLTLDTIQSTFLNWTDSLVHRYQVLKDMSIRSAYTKASHAAIESPRLS